MFWFDDMGGEPHRVDNELSNINSWREVHENGQDSLQMLTAKLAQLNTYKKRKELEIRMRSAQVPIVCSSSLPTSLNLEPSPLTPPQLHTSYVAL